MPYNFAKTPEGLLFAANGIDPVKKWDGLSPVMRNAGVPAPLTTEVPHVSGSGVGRILGTYYAYVRYVDKDGNVGNLSPISAPYTTVGKTGAAFNGQAVTGVARNSANPPNYFEDGIIRVTVPNHGFTIERNIVAVSPTSSSYVTGAITFSGVGGTTELNTTTFIYRIIDKDTFIVPVRWENPWTGGGQVLGNGLINTIGSSTPVNIESSNHGLETGDYVKVSGLNTIDGKYPVTVVDSDNFTLDGSIGSPTLTESASLYSSGATWTAGVDTIRYTSIPVSTDPRVVRRQILRNTDGQTETFYVDIDTEDLASTTLTSTQSDQDLIDTAEEVLLFDNLGRSLANRYREPPSHKPFIAHHQGRMWYAGERKYSLGACRVSFGSSTVTGVGTEWTEEFEGRFLYVVDAEDPYEIDAVDVDAQTLTIIGTYAGATNEHAVYSIQAAPAERKLIYWSESGLPDAVPAVNALPLQEDGDDVTGMIVQRSFLYILERRHIYKLTHGVNPAEDGDIWLQKNRGAVNQRCVVTVEDVSYMLDELGIHAFAGEDQHISTPIQDIFRNSDYEYRINWRASPWFHASHFPPQETIRFFVALSGEYLPRHAICLHIRLGRWWIEEYSVPIGCSDVATNMPVPVPLVGSHHRRVYSLWHGTLDGPDAAAGTVRSTITAVEPLRITDSAATFPADGMVNSQIVLVDGPGKGQSRTITEVGTNDMVISQPWLIMPEVGDTYQIGGIQWRWRCGQRQWLPVPQNSPRRVSVSWKPVDDDATMDMRFYRDYQDEPIAADADYPSSDRSGIAVTDGSPDYVVDLTKEQGHVVQSMAGWRDSKGDGKRDIRVELRGVQAADQVVIDNVTIEGAA